MLMNENLPYSKENVPDLDGAKSLGSRCSMFD